MVDRFKKRVFWEFFLEHKKFTIVLILAVVIMGIFSALSLPRESNPDIDIPVGVITTVFPGATALDVEELITNLIEDKVINIGDVEKVTSTSRDSVSVVVVEFNAKSDSDEKIDELKEKVDEVLSDLPDDANDPIVKKVRFSDEAIYTFTMSGEYTISELTRYAESLQDDLEGIAGVSKIEISGSEEFQVDVIVDRAQLELYGLNITSVTNAISTSNIDIPTGQIETNDFKYTVKFAGRLHTIEDIKVIPIIRPNGQVITVNDIALVRVGTLSPERISRLSLDGGEFLTAITFNIFKQGEGNIIDIVSAVNDEIAQESIYVAEYHLVFETIVDHAQIIIDDLDNLSSSALITILIVFVFLFIFLGFREALLASLAIPISFLMTFIVLGYMDTTINFLTLFSLILALGILIDSSVVVTEGVHRNIISGLNPKDAAKQTIRDYNMPLIAGSLTTVFAFIPMLMMSGMMGQFIRHIPITVTTVLLSSLFVSLGLITTLSLFFFKGIDLTRKKASNFEKRRRKNIEKLELWYKNILEKILHDKKSAKLLFGSIIVLFFLSLSLPVTGILQVNMFPPNDNDLIFVDLQLPTGTPIEITNKVMKDVESLIQHDERFDSIAVTVGSGSPTESGGGTGEEYAHMFINLSDDREESSLKIIEELDSLLQSNIDAKISVAQQGEGPPSGAPIEVAITGKNLADLKQTALAVESLLVEIEGSRDVKTTIEDSRSEFALNIDRNKASYYGVNTLQIAQILRNAVTGSTATVLRNEGEEMDVVVRYALNPNQTDVDIDRVSIHSLESLTVMTPRGSVPLSAFMYTDLTSSISSISHKDGDRILRVTGNIEDGANVVDVLSTLQYGIDKIELPESVAISYGGENEDVDQSFRDMFEAMFLAIFLIAALLILQFDSFRQPLFILATLPLAFIGVFPGLVLVGQPLSFPGIIGVVALVGIVVNNAIILIDRINKNRKAGDEINDAICKAGLVRLEPILLTTLTTVFGMIPITMSNDLWAPLGYAIIFGLSFSTVLTLLIVPLLYSKFGEKDLI